MASEPIRDRNWQRKKPISAFRLGLRVPRPTPLRLAAALACVPTLAAAQTFTDLGLLPGGQGSFATGVNGDGSVVVGYCFTPDDHAFRWTAASGITDLGTLS